MGLRGKLGRETGVRYDVPFNEQGEWVNICPRRDEAGVGYAVLDGFSGWNAYEQFVIKAIVWVLSPGFPSRYRGAGRILNIAFSVDEAQWAVEHIRQVPDDPVVITDERPDGNYDYTYHNGMYAFELVRWCDVTTLGKRRQAPKVGLERYRFGFHAGSRNPCRVQSTGQIQVVARQGAPQARAQTQVA